MMRRLILMRHAKSSWSKTGLRDHQRPLNARGRRSAQALGVWLKDRGYIPDQMISSDAVRVVETFKGLDLTCLTDFRQDLFHTGPATMVEALERATCKTVLMIGHNPAIGALAGWVVQQSPDHPRFHDYPTGATLIADFPVDSWADVLSKKAIARDFVVPRDLF